VSPRNGYALLPPRSAALLLRQPTESATLASFGDSNLTIILAKTRPACDFPVALRPPMPSKRRKSHRLQPTTRCEASSKNPHPSGSTRPATLPHPHCRPPNTTEYDESEYAALPVGVKCSALQSNTAPDNAASLSTCQSSNHLTRHRLRGGLLGPWTCQAAAGVTDPRGRRTPSWEGAITSAGPSGRIHEAPLPRWGTGLQFRVRGCANLG
jgi:hypothetical protein